jgi:flagellar basal body L-ring protein FlgH
MRASLAVLIVAALAVPGAATAQTPETAAAGSARDSSATAPAGLTGRAPVRLSWTSDRMPLRVGDLITVVVDEATAASERVSRVATGDHAIRADLNASVGTDVAIGPAKSFGSGFKSNSRDVGETGRQGDLTAVLTVQVTGLEGDGTIRIEGSKKVTVDGRVQDIMLKGLVRSQDVSPTNCVLSNRVANAEITYKGKKIAPTMGIVGRFLAMLWP